MKTLNPKKKRKAANSTQKIMREIEPFSPKRVRIFKEKFSEWRLRETPCPEKDRNVKALLSEL
jgi:hypothetical protein